MRDLLSVEHRIFCEPLGSILSYLKLLVVAQADMMADVFKSKLITLINKWKPEGKRPSDQLAYVAAKTEIGARVYPDSKIFLQERALLDELLDYRENRIVIQFKSDSDVERIEMDRRELMFEVGQSPTCHSWFVTNICALADGCKLDGN